jgi:FAD/FMN-containing dehydrogenase
MTRLLARLKDIVGEGGWIDEESALEPHVTEWRDRVRGRTPLVVFPRSVSQVADIVRACSHAGVALVPQGGNTGMCAGAVPDTSGEQVVINLARMNRIVEVDARDDSIIAEAGCVLADLQSAAAGAGRYLPLSLGGEGSCQVGGNVATNAGGINVLKYGNTRELVLGLEVVLADGRVWDGIRTLRKDNAGYDLKQLFIGSEGTLGIITAVALRLFPPPGPLTTALLALPSAADAVTVLGRLRVALGQGIEAFELISARAVELVERHIPDVLFPAAERSAWYVLTDIAAGESSDTVETVLATVLEDGLARDAIIAKNDAERSRLWRIRHSISEAERREGPGIKLDVSVPVGKMDVFLDRVADRLADEVPQAVPVVFGHVGDGNLHYNAHTADASPESVAAVREAMETVVYEVVTELRGSISAEHGIGVLKREALQSYGDPVRLSLMRTLKQALDPENLLNPGKVI